MKALSKLGEFGLIDLIRRMVNEGKGVIKGIGDDTAVLSYNARKHLLFTTDMLAEGVHFTRAMGGRSIGYKALACNISDIAAMGGCPTFAVISLGVPPNLEVGFALDIYKGMNILAKKFKVAIVGGDTIKSAKIIINVALLGEVIKHRLVTRAGAKIGDMIFITGPLGRSLQTGKHICFTPRLKESQYLVKNFKPTAMIDISDGLAADLGHILEESRGGAVIHGAQVPRNKNASLDQALFDGEDFELLFTLPRTQGQRLLKTRHNPFRFYPIGEIVHRNQGLSLLDPKGRKRNLLSKGFKHF